jgi:hypothetical protein
MWRRLTVRGLMAAVAVVALLIGGSLEYARLKTLGREYAGRAINARRSMEPARRSLGWSHERWMAECRRFDQIEQASGGWYKFPRPPSPEWAKTLVAYWEPVVAKYERAARYPWLPVEPDPPRPERSGNDARGG